MIIFLVDLDVVEPKKTAALLETLFDASTQTKTGL